MLNIALSHNCREEEKFHIGNASLKTVSRVSKPNKKWYTQFLG